MLYKLVRVLSPMALGADLGFLLYTTSGEAPTWALSISELLLYRLEFKAGYPEFRAHAVRIPGQNSGRLLRIIGRSH